MALLEENNGNVSRSKINTAKSVRGVRNTPQIDKTELHIP